jgi:hypothetical protein
MKKTYKNPEIEVIKLKMHQHLLNSSDMGANGDYGSGAGITLGAHEDDTEYEW